jgi:hypothetical protein
VKRRAKPARVEVDPEMIGAYTDLLCREREQALATAAHAIASAKEAHADWREAHAIARAEIDRRTKAHREQAERAKLARESGTLDDVRGATDKVIWEAAEPLLERYPGPGFTSIDSAASGGFESLLDHLNARDLRLDYRANTERRDREGESIGTIGPKRLNRILRKNGALAEPKRRRAK